MTLLGVFKASASKPIPGYALRIAFVTLKIALFLALTHDSIPINFVYAGF